MATIQYVVSAQDAASATFERIAGSADHVLEKLDEIGAKTAKARVGLEGDQEANLTLDKLDLKMAKFAQRVAKGKLGVDGGASAMLEIRKLELEMDKLNAKRAAIHIDTSALGRLSAFQPSAIGTAVALSPTLIPLLGQVAAGAAAVAVSFGAAAIATAGFGLMVGTVLSGATTDLQKLQTLNMNLAKASTAAQKKAIDQQITQLKAGWSKGYLDLIDNYQQFQQKWKSISQAITVPALNVWLPVLTEGLKFLKPLIKPIADAFILWGQSLNTYFKDPAAAKNIRDMAAAFGNFAAQQLFRIGQFIKDIGEGVFNLGKDLAASGANFNAFGPWLSNIGDAFLNWSKSKKARDEVQGFMQWIHDEGPVVKGILSDLGTLLPGIFAGATTVGTLELQALGNFLNLVASLPPGWQKPVTEFAGAMLLLSKIGVVSVGLKLTGLQGALEIPGLAGAGAAGGPLAAAGAAIAAGLVLRIREDLQKGLKGIVSDLPTFLSGSTGILQVSAAGWTDAITSRFEKPALAAEKAFGRAFVASAQVSWNAVTASMRAFAGDMVASMKAFGSALVASARAAWNAVAASFRAFTGTVESSMRAFGSDVVSIWNTIWRNTRNAVSTGVSAVVANFRTLPSRALAALTGLGHSLSAFASAAMNEMLNGFKNAGGAILKWLSGFVSSIISLVKKLLNIGSPSAVFHDIGVNMMLGLERGIKASAHKAANAAKGAVQGSVPGALGGPTSASAYQAQQYASSRLGAYGWGRTQFGPLLALWNQESGWNRLARNPSSGAYGIPQALPPGKMGAAANPPTSSAAAQINWGLSYIKGRYGSPAAAEQHELAFHWYDRGGWLPPGASLAMNMTGQPEQVVGPASMAQVTALLAQILAAVKLAPAATSAGTARALNSAARGAMGAR